MDIEKCKADGYKSYLAGRIMRIVFEKQLSESASKVVEEIVWYEFRILKRYTLINNRRIPKSFDDLCVEIINTIYNKYITSKKRLSHDLFRTIPTTQKYLLHN